MCSFPLLKIYQHNKNRRHQAKESQSLRSLVYISHRYERSRLLLIAEVTCFENALKTRRLIYPNIFLDQCLVEMIIFSRSVVSWGKAMYQNAFLSLNLAKIRLLLSPLKKQNLKNWSKIHVYILFKFDTTSRLRK